LKGLFGLFHFSTGVSMRPFCIERSNLSLRMACRRFTQLTNGFSKKWANHQAALSLWFAFYNFARVHMTLNKETPAMASGLEDHVWTIRELIEESAKS
jgi:hypothetical protein